MQNRFFPKNVHPIERGVRVVVGIGVLSLAFIGPETPWGYLGILPIVTGALGTCPLYTMLGVSTRRAQSHAS